MVPFTLKSLTLFALFGATSSLIILPVGLPDGHYTGDGTIDPATGFSSYTFTPLVTADYDNEEFNLTASPSAATLVRRATVNCNGRGGGDSVESVQKEFAKHWDGRQFSGSWARTTQGGSQAYACNYGGTQTIHTNDYLSNMGSVDSVCGKKNAGWFQHPEWKLNYGRDDINAGIC